MEYLYLFVTKLFLSVSLHVSPPLRLSLHWPAANWSPTALSTSSSGPWRCGREQEKGRERERESNDSSRAVNADHISQRPHQSEGKKRVAASQCKAARDGGNEWQIDRQAERWTEQGTQHLFYLPWPCCGHVAFRNPAQAVRHCGRECLLFCDHKFSLLSLYYINSDNVSQEVCVCVRVSSHFNLLESSLFFFFYYLSRPP